MENSIKKNKYIEIYGRILFFVFLGYGLFKLIFRKEFSKESFDNISIVFDVLIAVYVVVYISYQLKYNREHFIQNIKEYFKSYWAQIFFIVALLLIWFMNERS